jgi:1-acyl-sn-glycerol-3-phosphate acyltransferase
MNASEKLAPADRPPRSQPEKRAEEPLSSSNRMDRIRSGVLRRCVHTLFQVFTRLQVRGAEHIPPAGPCLLVINHVSNLDPPLIFATIGRSDTTALVASEYRANAVYRRAVEWAGGSWIQRGASDRGALDFAVAALRDGKIVGIAPEGGRSKHGQLREGKPGPAFLAVHAGVPILPVGLTGTGAIAAGIKRLRRVSVTVTFGPMFTLPAASGTAHKQYLQQCTTEIMCHIAALLPPEARGAYADTPRLWELLDSHASDHGARR